MAAALFFLPIPIALAGAELYFYQTGTLTPEDVFTSSALTTAHANPVVANGAGIFPAIYIDNELVYRLRILDADGNLLSDTDPYNSDDAGAGDEFLQAGTGAVIRTVQEKLRDLINVKDFGGVGNGTTNDRAAIAATDLIGAFIVTGNHRVSSDITITNHVMFVGNGRLTIDGGVTVTFRGGVTADDYRIFYGSGSAVGIRDVCPEWWGAVAVASGTPTDSLAALNAAHTCVLASQSSKGGRQRIRLLGGTYGVSATWTVTPTANCNLMVEGTGIVYGGSRLTDIAAFASTTTPVMLVDGSTDSIQQIADFALKDFAVVTGPGAATKGLQVGSDSSTKNIIGEGESLIDNVLVSGFANNVKFIHVNGINIPRLFSWNNVSTGACIPVLISVNGSFTGGLSFGDACRFVSNDATTSGTRCVKIEALTGLYSAVTGANSIGGIRFRRTEFFTGERALEIVAKDGCMISDVWLDGSQFDAQTTNTIHIEANKDTANTPVVRNVHIKNIYAQQSTANQISLVSTNSGVIQDVQICGNWLAGALASTVFCSGLGITALQVNGNSIVNNDFDNGATGYAIDLGTCIGFQCRGNILQREDGVSNPDYMIRIASGANHYIVSDNISQGLAAVGIVLDSGGAVTKSVGDNI